MISDTLASRLQEYGIGPKIRALRLAKRISLIELGKHSGLSSGLLSKIERGILIPPLPTLLRIALVFGVGLEHFFTAGARPVMAVVRKQDRLQMPNDPEEQSGSYVFESLDYPVTDRRMDAYLAEFQSQSSPHAHAGPEFIYVMSGQLVVTVDGSDSRLEQGDAMYFDSSFPHSYRPQGRALCSALVVVARE